MVRRLHLYFEHAGRGVAAATRVAELMGRERGWDEARVAAEADRYVEFARGPLGLVIDDDLSRHPRHPRGLAHGGLGGVGMSGQVVVDDQP